MPSTIKHMTRRLLAIALAGLSLGCAQDPVIPTIGEEPIVLSLGFSTKTFRVGKPDTISVIATSALTSAALVAYGTDCRFLVTIRSATGQVVVPPNGQRLCIPLVSPVVDTFPPNGVITRRFVWTGRSDFVPSGTTTTALPAGTYYISAAINALNYSTIAPAVKVDFLAQ